MVLNRNYKTRFDINVLTSLGVKQRESTATTNKNRYKILLYKKINIKILITVAPFNAIQNSRQT